MVDDLKKQDLYEENFKSIGVAYLLWLFFGAFSIHRFYAGRTKSGVARLVLLMIPFIGWAILTLLWIADLFLIPGMINERNRKTIEMINGSERGPAKLVSPDPQHPAEVQTESRPLDPRRQQMLDDLRQTGYKKERRDRVF